MSATVKPYNPERPLDGFNKEVQMSVLTHITPPWDLLRCVAASVLSFEHDAMKQKKAPYSKVAGNFFTRWLNRKALYWERTGPFIETLVPEEKRLSSTTDKATRLDRWIELSAPSLIEQHVSSFNRQWVAAGDAACKGDTREERELSFAHGVLGFTTAWLENLPISPVARLNAARERFMYWRMCDVGMLAETMVKGQMFVQSLNANREAVQDLQTLSRQIEDYYPRAYPGQPGYAAAFDPRIGPTPQLAIEMARSNRGWFTGEGLCKISLSEVNECGIENLPRPLTWKLNPRPDHIGKDPYIPS